MAREKDDAMKLIQKLQEIMDPSNNATEGEIAASAASIQRLLKSHNLELTEIEAFGEELAAKQEFKVGVFGKSYIKRSTLCSFQKSLMMHVAMACECKVFFSSRYTSGKSGKTWIITFVGVETDSLMAAELFNYLNKAIFRLARKEFPGSNKEQTAFHMGCTSRLGERFYETEKEFNEEHEEYAMVLYDKKAEIVKFMSTLSLTRGRSGGRRTSGSRNAFDRGREAGDSMDITTGRHLSG